MKLLRYPDLKAMGVVGSRMTLKRLIHMRGFPPGVLITPNARAWLEDEVDLWIANRPTARKPAACAATGAADRPRQCEAISAREAV
jgi:predicted DNA-binding transcriptional regulator AlpA